MSVFIFYIAEITGEVFTQKKRKTNIFYATLLKWLTRLKGVIDDMPFQRITLGSERILQINCGMGTEIKWHVLSRSLFRHLKALQARGEALRAVSSG